ncbi:hypothetical protein [Bacillus thuringiensis]|uniref:hypothetical protein n=1 Tax=Bacillus thuringiensis TaxID=1428 RepID=UPI0037D425DD
MRISEESHLQATIKDMKQFEDRLQQLSLKIYPSDALRDFVKIELLPILKDFQQMLLLQMESLNNGASQNVSPEIKATINFWWSGNLQSLANVISNADLKSSPFEIMGVFKKMISKIDAEDFEIITSPTNDLNFTFREIWQQIKIIIESLMGEPRQTNKKLIELTFPAQHKDNIFLSGIFAHEIGHYFDRNKNIWSDIFTRVALPGNNYIQQLKPFFKRYDNIPIDDAEVLAILNKSVLGAWIREAIADCVAVYLLGPAFIFSSQELLISVLGRNYILTNNLIDSPAPTHPRHGLRLSFQLETLKSLQLYDALPTSIQTVLDEIKFDWENANVYYDQVVLNDQMYSFLLNDNSYRLLEELWRQCLPYVQQEVSSLIGPNVMTTLHIEEAEVLARERIRWLVPPNEINGQFANAQAIINSGWFAKLLYTNEILSLVNRTQQPESEYELTDIVNGLLKYAIHASPIHERW